MRNNLIVATLLLGVLSLGSCGRNGSKSSTDNLGFTFDSVKIDTIAALVQKEGSPRCELHINMIYAKGDKGDVLNETLIKSGILTPDYLGLVKEKMSVPDAVDSFMTRYIADYRKTFGYIYKQDPTAASLNTQYDVKTKVEMGRNGVVSYIASTYRYEGGAHGISSTVVKNIDPKTGKVLTLKDVFLTGSNSHLKDLIVEKLQEKANVDNLKALQDKGYFMDMTPYVTDNFILGTDKVIFIYCSDEIAPHVLGEIRVELPVSDIDEYLK